MCGIAGYLGDDSARGAAFAERANRLLAHRGPNDQGIYLGTGIALANRRLAIVDLSAAGHQPMISPDGRWVLAYNGEIYNHTRLRSRLESRWDFRGHSDTETVLAALALEGPRALEDMVGMWALALWDSWERQLLVSRDRYGQKPLYWRQLPDRSIVLASEIKVLLGDDERPVMYAPAVAAYMSTGHYGHLADRTFYRDIRSFPPAHWGYIAAADRQLHARRYWSFPVASHRERRPYDEAAQRLFRTTLEEAVTSQLMSDVPVGATLSGGLDSSTTVGIMAKCGPRSDRIPVFTAQSHNTPHDESRYVNAVEERWPGRFDLHWVEPGEILLRDTLASYVRQQEEPFGDPSIVAHGLLMEAAQKAGVPVLLSGQGGDELLFGYAAMRWALLAEELRRGDRTWAVEEVMRQWPKFNFAARVIFAAAFPQLEVLARRRSHRRRRHLLRPRLRRGSWLDVAPLSPSVETDSVWLEFLESTTLPHLVHYDDRNSMARSIEGRMPFLDHRLGDVVGSLEANAFEHKGLSKRILRDACDDLLPSAISQRRDKIGFFTPLRVMLGADIEWVRRMVTDDFARTLDIYDVDVIASMIDDCWRPATPDELVLPVWRALSVRIWAEEFKVSTVDEHSGLRSTEFQELRAAI